MDEKEWNRKYINCTRMYEEREKCWTEKKTEKNIMLIMEKEWRDHTRVILTEKLALKSTY